MGKENDLSDQVKGEIVQFLLTNCKDGQPMYGKKGEAATRFNCSGKTIQRLWKSAQTQMEKGEVIQVTNKRQGRFRASKHEVNFEAIEAIHYQKRGTIRALADALGITKSVVGRWCKDKLIRARSNAIKPHLTDPNKLERLIFTLQAIQFESETNSLKFKPMENTIHIDEKWFYLTKKSHGYYMTPLEADPYRTCKSSKFIPKVMFMCAVCRPVFDENGTCIFDGKIGMWPFTEEYTAQRDSKKRKKGTVEIKPIASITRQVIKDCILNQMVPTIKNKWPACLSKTIHIQQDNAKPHINNKDPDFRAVACSDGFNISLVQQPPNSPDLNVNDLGFFRAIQSLQQQQACKNADELIVAVLTAFENFDPMTLNKVFLSLQCCQVEIMKLKGTNGYKQPHMGKDALILENALPTNLQVEEELVKECIDYLISEGFALNIEELIEELGLEIPI